MIKVLEVQPMDNYKLRVRLSDGKVGIFDVASYLDKGIFRELKDPAYFSMVRTAFDGIAWPHEQDFSADTIEIEMEILQLPEVAAANVQKSSLTP